MSVKLLPGTPVLELPTLPDSTVLASLVRHCRTTRDPLVRFFYHHVLYQGLTFPHRLVVRRSRPSGVKSARPTTHTLVKRTIEEGVAQ